MRIWSYHLKDWKKAIKTSYELDKLISENEKILKAKQDELDKAQTEYDKIKEKIQILKNTKFYLWIDIDMYYARKIKDNEKIGELIQKNHDYIIQKWHATKFDLSFLYSKDKDSLL